MKIGKWSDMLVSMRPERCLVLALMKMLSMSDSVVVVSPFSFVMHATRVGFVIVGMR